MGLTRKLTSAMTLGAVDFRSAKDRTAAYTRGTRRQARKQTKIMDKQTKLMGRAAKAAKTTVAPAPVAAVPTGVAAGWYRDGDVLRYWDGTAWTCYTA